MTNDEIVRALRCDVEQGNEGGSRCYREGEDCRDCPNYYEGGDHIMAMGGYGFDMDSVLKKEAPNE